MCQRLNTCLSITAISAERFVLRTRGNGDLRAVGLGKLRHRRPGIHQREICVFLQLKVRGASRPREFMDAFEIAIPSDYRQWTQTAKLHGRDAAKPFSRVDHPWLGWRPRLGRNRWCLGGLIGSVTVLALLVRRGVRFIERWIP